jgi:spermidine synthase / saccharopine dehydrogenase (NADP+, L-glutamate-forming)
MTSSSPSPAFAFVAYPNRNSVPFREWYKIPECTDVVRETMRYQGFPELIKVLVGIGLLDDGKKDYLGNGMKWREVTARALSLHPPLQNGR